MSDDEQQQYINALSALAECVYKGVSDKAVNDLAALCGIDKRDLQTIYNFKVAA